MDSYILLAVVVIMVMMFMMFYNNMNNELNRLKELQRLDELDDASKDRLLEDLKYKQEKYDRWRYWAGPNYRRWGRRRKH